MARSRRGSFGLQPRVAPNVSGQIVALAREYVQKRQALIMDAWRNGGTFEGKKATDEMVLKFWEGEAKDLSKDDPNYESAQNNIMQLQYGIAQSKADVLHAQGKLSDTAYAQFFLKWAAKVPHNSEFYRTLQKDAAQLIESSKAKSRANGERAKTEAFNTFVKSMTDSKIAIGDAMTAALSKLSKDTGLSITGNGDELLAMLTSDVKSNPDSYRLLLDTIHKGDPHFDGQLTEGYFSQHIKEAVAGYDLIADRAQQAGYVSAYASAAQGMASMNQWGQNLKVWPVSETYSTAMNAFNKVMADPNASQMDKTTAAAAASAQLTELTKTSGIDAGSKSMIEADAQRLLGQDAGDNPSFGASMLGREGLGPQTAMQIGAWTKTAQEMAANPTAYSYAPVDQNGQFDPTGRGPLGIVPAGAVQPGAQAVMVPGRDGKAVMAMVMPHSVYTTDPNNPSASPKLAGHQIAYNVGGKQVQMWGYQDDRGGNHWSLVSPLAPGAQSQTDNKGDVYISPQASTATDPFVKATQLSQSQDATMAALGKQLVAQMSSQKTQGNVPGNTSVETNQLDNKGHVTGSVKLSYDNGVFTAMQTTNQLDAKGRVLATSSTPITIPVNSAESAAFSSSTLAAGDIPGVTFSSAMQASVKAASYTQTQDQVQRFASDPAFQQAFLSQTMASLGTQNPYDPRIASAWKDVTTASHVGATAEQRAHMSANQRADLRYPGVESNPAAYNSKVEINFGGHNITIPGLPSYLNGVKGAGGPASGPSAASWATASPWANLLPGLGLAQQPQGSPAPTITPSPTNANTGITPMPSGLPAPTPTPAPTSTPLPTPAPTGGGGAGGRRVF